MAVVHDSVMQTAWDGQTDTARPRVTWGHVEVAVFGFVIHFGCPFARSVLISPSPAGRSPQRAGTHAKCGRILHGARGRAGVGVAIGFANVNFLLFTFALLSQTLSLASQAMLVAARAVPVPQGEGAAFSPSIRR